MTVIRGKPYLAEDFAHWVGRASPVDFLAPSVLHLMGFPAPLAHFSSVSAHCLMVSAGQQYLSGHCYPPLPAQRLRSQVEQYVSLLQLPRWPVEDQYLNPLLRSLLRHSRDVHRTHKIVLDLVTATRKIHSIAYPYSLIKKVINRTFLTLSTLTLTNDILTRESGKRICDAKCSIPD